MLEVQVPVLSKHTVTDPDIESISVSGHGYLQTSPEYLMKKLLSSGLMTTISSSNTQEKSGDIHAQKR